MENCIISHFGLFEVENQLVFKRNTTNLIRKTEKKARLNDQSLINQQAKKMPFQWFFNLLFKKIF